MDDATLTTGLLTKGVSRAIERASVAFDRSAAAQLSKLFKGRTAGAVDSFTVEGSRYHLEGDWGTLQLDAAGVDVTLHD